jgi:nucleotide-binding universal stress UspA family protein
MRQGSNRRTIAPMRAPYIAGFDGTATAAAAVRLTARLAAGADAQVVVAHAFAPGHDIADARAASDELLARVREPGMRLRSIAAHSAAEGLRDLARHEGAGLLAVGRTHHGPVGRALAESVPDELVSRAPCPVLVVPPGRRGPTGVVGVAFDGRDESRAALDVARDLARIMGARIVLLGVPEPPSFLGTGAVAASRRTLDSELHEASERMRLAVEEAGHGSAECRALHGPVGPALANACRDGIDLLVAGSRGYGPIAAVIAGSVSRHLAHHAPCPVLVVPRGARGLEAAGRPTVSAA